MPKAILNGFGRPTEPTSGSSPRLLARQIRPKLLAWVNTCNDLKGTLLTEDLMS